MIKKIKGTNAKLINEGSDLTDQVKVMNGRLKEIKAILTEDLGEGTFTTKKGYSLCISSFDKWTDVTPESALNALKKMRLGQRYQEVIKVQITPLKKLIGEARLDDLRAVISKTFRCTFK